MSETEKEVLISVQNLKKHFPILGGVFSRIVGYVYALDGVSFEVKRGETVGVVGESGCGKTTLGRVILKLIEKTDGDVFFDNTDVHSQRGRDLIKLRKKMQIVQQDPYASLNPRQTVKSILTEPIKIHKLRPKRQINQYILNLLNEVGLSQEHLNRFPHEFSGGQRQRICIARALVMEPEFIVLDEPTASTDVSVQAKILKLLKRLQNTRQLSFLFISHDLSVVSYMSDIVVVMYLGRVMEIGSKEIFLGKAKSHPYTRALASAIPIPDPFFERERIILEGDVPNPASPPSGCVFHTRCPYVKDICKKEMPRLVTIEGRHKIACLIFDEKFKHMFENVEF